MWLALAIWFAATGYFEFASRSAYRGSAPAVDPVRLWFGVVTQLLLVVVYLASFTRDYAHYAVGPDGVEFRRLWWRRWFVPWDDYAQWRWRSEEKLRPRFPRMMPRELVIETKSGPAHRIRFGGARMDQGRVVPDKQAARLLDALWTFGPHTGLGWTETVGYVPPVPSPPVANTQL